MPVLYIILAMCDFVSGFIALLHAGLMFNMLSGRWDDDGDKLWLISISYTFTTVTSRTSILYNVILAVARTINIIHPFYIIKKTWVVISAVIYPFLWVCISVADIIIMLRVGGWVFVYLEFNVPIPGECVMTGDCNATQNTVVFVLLGIPFIIPVILMGICAIIQIYTLLKQPTVTNTGKASKQRNMTVTIALMTITCILCNIVYIILWVLVYYTDLFLALPNRWSIIIPYIASTTLPFINSSINPLILIIRGSEIREYVMRYVRYVITKMTIAHRE